MTVSVSQSDGARTVALHPRGRVGERKLPPLYFCLGRYGEFRDFFTVRPLKRAPERDGINIYPGQRQHSDRALFLSFFLLPAESLPKAWKINTSQADAPGSTRCSVIRGGRSRKKVWWRRRLSGHRNKTVTHEEESAGERNSGRPT